MSNQEKVFLIICCSLIIYTFVLLNRKVFYLDKIIKNIAKNFFQE